MCAAFGQDLGAIIHLVGNHGTTPRLTSHLFTIGWRRTESQAFARYKIYMAIKQ